MWRSTRASTSWQAAETAGVTSDLVKRVYEHKTIV